MSIIYKNRYISGDVQTKFEQQLETGSIVLGVGAVVREFAAPNRFAWNISGQEQTVTDTEDFTDLSVWEVIASFDSNIVTQTIVDNDNLIPSSSAVFNALGGVTHGFDIKVADDYHTPGQTIDVTEANTGSGTTTTVTSVQYVEEGLTTKLDDSQLKQSITNDANDVVSATILRAEFATKADTDLSNVDSDLTDQEQADFRAKIGAGTGSGTGHGDIVSAPTESQQITQPSGTVLDITGSFDLNANSGSKAFDFSGTSGDIHLEHNSEIYTLVDKDQKKIYYDTTNTEDSFPTTGRAGKELVIKDDLTLLADEITAIEIQRNAQGQTMEEWEDAGSPGGTFVPDSAFSITEVSLANNLSLLANDNYSKMIVATENGNNYHFDLLRFQALNGRLILQTDNLVTRLANIDTAIANAGGGSEYGGQWPSTYSTAFVLNQGAVWLNDSELWYYTGSTLTIDSTNDLNTLEPTSNNALWVQISPDGQGKTYAGDAFPSNPSDGDVFYLEMHDTTGTNDDTPGWYVYRTAKAANGTIGTDYNSAVVADWYVSGESIEAVNIYPTLGDTTSGDTIEDVTHSEQFEITAGIWTFDDVAYIYNGFPHDIDTTQDLWDNAPLEPGTTDTYRTGWRTLDSFESDLSGGVNITNYAVLTAYAVGDFVYHKGEIFRCHTAYTSPNASLEVFGPQNQPEHWGAVTENVNAIDTLEALEDLNTSAGTSATIRVGDYFAVQGDTEANRGLYVVTATDNSNPPSTGTTVTKIAGLGGATVDARFSGTVDSIVHTDTGVNVSARLDSVSAITDTPITIILPSADTYDFQVGQNISSSNGGVSRTIIRLIEVEAGTELILDGHHASEFNNGADIFVDTAAHNENTVWTLPQAGATAYTQNDDLINNLIATDHSLEEQIQANATAIAAFQADLVSIAAYQPQGAYLSGAGDITPSYSTDQVDRSGSKTGTGYANTGAIRVYHDGRVEIISYLLMPEGTNTDGTGTNAPDIDYVDAFEEQFKTEDIIGHALVSGAYTTQGFPHIINTTLETAYDNGFGTGLKAYFLNGQYQGRVEVRFQGQLTPSQNSDRTFITDHSDRTILYDNYTSYQVYPTNAFWHNVRIADPEQIFLIKEGVFLLHEIADAAVPANVGKVLAVTQDENRVDTFNFPAGNNLSSDLSFTLSRPPSGNVTFSSVTGATITNTGSLVTFDYVGAVAKSSFTATYATTGIEAVDNAGGSIKVGNVATSTPNFIDDTVDTATLRGVDFTLAGNGNISATVDIPDTTGFITASTLPADIPRAGDTVTVNTGSGQTNGGSIGADGTITVNVNTGSGTFSPGGTNTDGYVLTADGASGYAWEIASGGFTDGDVVRLGVGSTLGADGSAVAIATTDDLISTAEQAILDNLESNPNKVESITLANEGSVTFVTRNLSDNTTESFTTAGDPIVRSQHPEWVTATPPLSLGAPGSFALDDTQTGAGGTTVIIFWIRTGDNWQSYFAQTATTGAIAFLTGTGTSGDFTLIPGQANAHFELDFGNGDGIINNLNELNGTGLTINGTIFRDITKTVWDGAQFVAVVNATDDTSVQLIHKRVITGNNVTQFDLYGNAGATALTVYADQGRATTLITQNYTG